MRLIRPLFGDLAYVALFGILLFGPARRFDWPRAWVLLAILLALRLAITVAVTRVDRALLIERSRLPVHAGQPLADRVLLIAFMASFAAQVAFTSADHFYFRFLPHPPVLLSALGLPCFIAGWAGIGLVLYTNTFAITVVRHQADREQRVISSGPYRVVRHPMYASLMLIFVGLPLWLGSVAGIVAGIVPTFILIARIRNEERFLLRALPAYADYAMQTPWRLVPGMW